MNSTNTSLLIVDDNQINLDLLCRYLVRKGGYNLTTAENGKQALELIEVQKFDLVLLDLLMPDLSGYEVLKILRQKFSMIELPIIMLTAKQENEALVDTLRLGANDFVVKPIEFNILNARIDTQIALKRKEEDYRVMKGNLEQLVRERTEKLDNANKALEQDRQYIEYLLSSSPVIIDTEDHRRLSSYVTSLIEKREYSMDDLMEVVTLQLDRIAKFQPDTE